MAVFPSDNNCYKSAPFDCKIDEHQKRTEICAETESENLQD